VGNSVEVTGFHAKRCEFDPEYDHEAECVVADLEFREDDPDVEVQVRAYQQKGFKVTVEVIISSIMSLDTVS